MSSAAVIRTAPQVACQPIARAVLPPDQWAALQPDDVVLHAFWADTAEVHALFSDLAGQPLLASSAVREGRYFALSPQFPSAAALERMVHDLWGHAADTAADTRPWLDHGQWGLTRPLHPRPGLAETPAEPVFRPISPELMQVPIGPVPGIPAEPAHLRVGTDGVHVRSVEARLGYAHKGALLLMRGKSPRAAARFAARLSADATVANSLAFARATEAALRVEVSLRALLLRSVMSEWERITAHLSALAACCPSEAQFGWHREHMLRVSAAVFGHRILMDCVVPGGLSVDLPSGGETVLLDRASALSGDLPRLTKALRRIGEGIGVVPAEALAVYAPAGIVARSAGLAIDARHIPGYPPYQVLGGPIDSAGDVAARLRQRLLEIGESIALLNEWLRGLPPGGIGQSLPPGSGEGLAVAEGPRGAIWHWLRLDGGIIASTFAADPSWRLWPLQEAACIGARVEDLSLIDWSFACARSGVDL